jgi:hypothetical protein
MSTLNFPSNPATGDKFTVGSNTWQWTGTAWIKAPGQDNTFGILTATSVVISSVTNAISTVTGSLVVYGGVGIGGDLWLGGDLYARGRYVITTATFADGILAGDDIKAVIEVGSGAVIISNTSTLQTVTTRGSTTTNAISFLNTTDSTSTTTGALVVSGGVGIGGNLALGGRLYAGGTTGTVGQVLTTTATGVVWSTPMTNYDGGTINLPLRIANTTSSTSTTTGALVVSGGVGIGGDVWIRGRQNSESVKIADTIFDSSSVTVNSTTPTVIDSFSFTQFRSAKYMVQVDEGPVPGARCQVTELMLLVSNSGNVSILEYGNIFPDGDLGNFDVDFQNTGGDQIVSLKFIAFDSTPKTVKVLRTAMAV